MTKLNKSESDSNTYVKLLLEQNYQTIEDLIEVTDEEWYYYNFPEDVTNAIK